VAPNQSCGDYSPLSEKFISAAANSSLSAWAAIPCFNYTDVSTVTDIDTYVQAAKAALKKNGYKHGKNYVIVGHSLGGFLTQDYVSTSHGFTDTAMSAQILLGSILQRKYRTISPTSGKSTISLKTKTLTLSGGRDGLTRITRTAEAYWH